MTVNPSHYSEPGLYLHLPDGRTLALTQHGVEERAQAVLANPSPRVPLTVIESGRVERCGACPQSASGDVCRAIRPILAVWELFDHFHSYDPVTAVYRGSSSHHIVAAETTMQRALQYVSMLSLLYYCDTGRTYWRYFYGVNPLMAVEDVAVRVHLNMFWASGGDAAKTEALAERFNSDITATAQCQMDRVRQFCKNDAFLNALILTQIASEFLSMNMDHFIAERVDQFAREFFV